MRRGWWYTHSDRGSLCWALADCHGFLSGEEEMQSCPVTNFLCLLAFHKEIWTLQNTTQNIAIDKRCVLLKQAHTSVKDQGTESKLHFTQHQHIPDNTKHSYKERQNQSHEETKRFGPSATDRHVNTWYQCWGTEIPGTNTRNGDERGLASTAEENRWCVFAYRPRSVLNFFVVNRAFFQFSHLTVITNWLLALLSVQEGRVQQKNVRGGVEWKTP